MAKTIKHYEIFINYTDVEKQLYQISDINKPDYLAKDIPSEGEKTFKFYTPDLDLIIIMQSVVKKIEVKRVYENRDVV